MKVAIYTAVYPFVIVAAVVVGLLLVLAGCTANQIGSAAKNCYLPGDETGYHNSACDGFGRPKPVKPAAPECPRDKNGTWVCQ